MKVVLLLDLVPWTLSFYLTDCGPDYLNFLAVILYFSYNPYILTICKVEEMPMSLSSK